MQSKLLQTFDDIEHYGRSRSVLPTEGRKSRGTRIHKSRCRIVVASYSGVKAKVAVTTKVAQCEEVELKREVKTKKKKMQKK